MSRSKQFVTNFNQPLQLMFDNLGHDMEAFVFVYVRDKLDKTEGEDGAIEYSLMSKMRIFDGVMVKELIKTEIDKLSMDAS